MDHAYTMIHGLERRLDGHVLIINEHAALEAACAMNDRHTKHDIHQRGFACAILSDQGVDFADPDIEANVFKHGVTGIILGNILKTKKVLTHSKNPAPKPQRT
jgi:hypothetical protein